MPPGRPRKYKTDEERRLACNASKRASYQRNAPAIIRRRRFKRVQRTARPSTGEASSGEEGDGGCRDTADSREPLMPPGLQMFHDANPSSPADPLQDHLFAALENAPNPTEPVVACSYWRPIFAPLRGRALGEFAFKLLAVTDGDQFRRRMKDFESVLFSIDTIAKDMRVILETAATIDPSGTAGPYLDAKWLCRDVEMVSLHLDEIVSLRRSGLETLLVFARRNELEFQNFDD